MKNFTIANETNNIMIHGSAKEAEAVPDSERFSNEAALAKLAANWPTGRLVEIWNSLPGTTPVKKLKDRATAVSRIWKALQGLCEALPPETAKQAEPEPVAETHQDLSPEARAESEAAPAPEASPVPSPEANFVAPIAPQTADVAPEAAPAKTRDTHARKTATGASASAPREGSKTGQVIAMLKREGGTTLEEIMNAMGWQKHTTRAMLSMGGSLTKNHGLIITSEKVGEKRTYSIKA